MATAVATVTAGLGLIATSFAVAPQASAASCSDVELVVARGTYEPGTLGVIVGDPVLSDAKSKLPGKTVTGYPVNYPANADADSERKGNLDVVAHITQQAAACPATKFVLVGYSQGAEVVDHSVGTDTTGIGPNGGAPPAAVIPAALSGRIAATLTFGNPITAKGKAIPAPYVSNYKDFCRDGDPVCNANGTTILAHLFYFLDAGTAGTFIAAKV
jgi:cutinase